MTVGTKNGVTPLTIETSPILVVVVLVLLFFTGEV